MTETVNGTAFAILAAAVLIGAFNMMSTPNVVRAGYWLLETLVATAGIYLLLSAEFVAVVQLMVYAGAVTVMVLFVIMLTLRSREDAERSLDFDWRALAGAVLFAVAMTWSLWRFRPVRPPFPPAAPGTVALAKIMFTTWILPFELASVVLLVALVGGVWWATGSDRR